MKSGSAPCLVLKRGAGMIVVGGAPKPAVGAGDLQRQGTSSELWYFQNLLDSGCPPKEL